MNNSILSFAELLKHLRKNVNINQFDFAKSIGVSKILIAKVESGAKEPTRFLVEALAKKLEVHPSVLMPFIPIGKKDDFDNLSSIEKKFISMGAKLQKSLIIKKSKFLLRDQI